MERYQRSIFGFWREILKPGFWFTTCQLIKPKILNLNKREETSVKPQQAPLGYQKAETPVACGCYTSLITYTESTLGIDLLMASVKRRNKYSKESLFQGSDVTTVLRQSFRLGCSKQTMMVLPFVCYSSSEWPHLKGLNFQTVFS